MSKNLIIRIAKNAGIILAILSTIYTLIQIVDYFNNSKDKISASYKIYDLRPYINNLDVSNYYESALFYPYPDKTKINILNKYLKDSLPYENPTDKDTIIRNKLSDIKNVFSFPMMEAMFRGGTILEIYVQNVSDKEIKDIKIDLSDWYTVPAGKCSYYIQQQSIESDNDTPNLKILQAPEKVILLGNLLPRQPVSIIIFGLSSFYKPYPRIIYPEGYVNAFGSSNLYHTSKFDEWVTEIIVSSPFLQVILAILTVLGFIYFFKLTYQLTKKVFNK